MKERQEVTTVESTKSEPGVLYELIASPREMACRFPNNGDGEPGWFLFELEVDNKQALDMALKLAGMELPVLMFTIINKAQSYLVCGYATERQLLKVPELWKLSCSTYFGWERIVECGRNGFCRPCIGWWNI
jgi:hypothetical protein